MKRRSNPMKDKRKLTLDQVVPYEIKVPGQLDASWIDQAGQTTIKVLCHGNEPPVTTLTGTFDQAALHGLLRRLYALGLPLISVVRICKD